MMRATMSPKRSPASTPLGRRVLAGEVSHWKASLPRSLFVILIVPEYPMSDRFAADFPPLVSREQARNAVADALRLFVGRGRRYSVKELANATGIPDWQINTALIRGDHPDNRPLPPEALVSIASFLGPVFTNKWLGLAKQMAVYSGEVDHDELADAVADYLHEKNAAHHPESEAGRDIGPTEKARLDSKVVALPIARRA
jgi:hypothetical protein